MTEFKRRRRRYRNYKQDMKKAIPWLVAAAVAFFVLFTNVSNYRQPEIEVLTAWENSEGSEEAAATGRDEPLAPPEEVLELYWVDVAGAVLNPGVVQLPADSRVYQAVEAAGGLATDSDTREVNLAARLTDGQKIYIPSQPEVAAQERASGQSAGSGFVPRADPESTVTAQGKVNINADDIGELQKLSGVGPATAARILAYRQENGNFKVIEDLKNVKGIGEKTFEKLKDSIYVP